MKPEDIIVGKRYVNAYCFGDVWLGIGKRKLFTQDEIIPETKTLVLIESSNPQNIGRLIHHGEDSMEGFWDAFQLEKDGNFYIFTQK